MVLVINPGQRRVDEPSSQIILILIGAIRHRSPLRLSLRPIVVLSCKIILAILINEHLTWLCIISVPLIGWILSLVDSDTMLVSFTFSLILLRHISALFFFLVLELSDQSVASSSNLSSLVATLVLIDEVFLIDHWHIFKS